MKHSGDIEPCLGQALGILLSGNDEQIDRPKLIGPLGKHTVGIPRIEADSGPGLTEGLICLFEGEFLPTLRGPGLEKIDPGIEHLLSGYLTTDQFEQS